jgi:hypothetical protein
VFQTHVLSRCFKSRSAVVDGTHASAGAPPSERRRLDMGSGGGASGPRVGSDDRTLALSFTFRYFLNSNSSVVRILDSCAFSKFDKVILIMDQLIFQPLNCVRLHFFSAFAVRINLTVFPMPLVSFQRNQGNWSRMLQI